MKTSKHIVYGLLTTGLFALLQSACSGDKPKTETETLPVLAPSLTWNVPVDLPDSPATQVQFTLFGWQSFIALNWPANLTQRGLPDTTKSFGADGIPVVWETFKEKSETFLPTASDPGSWFTAGEDLTKKRLMRFTKFSNTIPLDTMTPGNTPNEFDQADGGHPLIDQDSNYVSYEIMINESEYTYIRENNYYNATNQKNDVHNNAFVIPPKGPNSEADTALMQMLPPDARYGATELKAAWRVLPTDMPLSQRQRYYRRMAVRDLPGGSTDTVEVGLVGLHILRLTRSTHATWFWATFEHVDNDVILPQYGGTPPATPTFNPGPSGTPAPPYPAGYCYNTTNCENTLPPAPLSATQIGLPKSGPVNVSRITPIDALVDSLNKVYFKLFRGTVWQYYRMIGVLNQVPTGNPNTAVANAPGVFVNAFPLPNITMETYAQVKSPKNKTFASNCVSCHAFGFPLSYPADSVQVSNYQIFTFLLSDAATAATTPKPTRVPEAEKPKK